jgi:hypothetical protein
MSHVFISYVRQNAVQVERIAGELRSHGLDVWLDRDSILPGMVWKDAIRDAIKNGAFFVACFSAEFEHKQKSHMNEELNLAIEELRQSSYGRIWFIVTER